MDSTSHKRIAIKTPLMTLSRHTKLILCSVAEGVIVLDLQGAHIFVNSAAERMLGYKANELLGHPSHNLWHPTKADGSPYPAEECLICSSFRDGLVHYTSTDTKLFWRKDGTNFPVEYTSKPIFEQGQLVGAVITFLGITESKIAEDALRESERLYRSLFDNMMNGCAYCRILFEDGAPQDFIYLAVNDAFENQTGLKGVVGKKVSEVIPGIRETNPQLLEIYRRVALTHQPERFEMFIEPLKMWFSVSVYCPAHEHFVAVFDVVTERKLAELERERLLAELQEALSKVKLLSGLLPTCCKCQKIRDEKGDWHPIETYIIEHSEATFTHGICQDCALKLYPELMETS